MEKKQRKVVVTSWGELCEFCRKMINNSSWSNLMHENGVEKEKTVRVIRDKFKEHHKTQGEYQEDHT